MQVGYIGLGKMGKNMALRLSERGVKVVAWNRSPEPVAEISKAGGIGVSSIDELVTKLVVPRLVWVMLPAGEATEGVMQKLKQLLSAGDTVIDGGNGFYKDAQRRGGEFAQLGIEFIDVGVSGGPKGAREGACLMIGGDENKFEKLMPLWEAIAAPKAIGFFGTCGAGHFAKMVHNGIEYGMMEAIAEGAEVLEKSGFKFDLAEVFRVYNNKSVIESRLVGWAQEALNENVQLTGISDKISHTGEGAWTVDVARELGVATPVIEASLKVRIESDEKTESFRNRMVSALRGKFGQHKIS